VSRNGGEPDPNANGPPQAGDNGSDIGRLMGKPLRRLLTKSHEMLHDARIVRMNAQHLPKNIRRWMGDSVGHWERDTLVVDTTNFNDKRGFAGRRRTFT
jgi:hypothetical protein